MVAESIVVIKKLLQTQPTQHSDIIKHMAKLFDNVTVRFLIALVVKVIAEALRLKQHCV